MYQIKIKQFEGPFDLLLELIDKKKLPVNEVSLAEVSDQYLNHLKSLPDFPTNEVASFIVIASTLVLIKSRSLMPSLALSSDEETEIRDLEERLRLYKIYRALAKELEKIFGKQVIFARESMLQTETIFAESKDLSLENIFIAAKEMLARLPEKENNFPKAIVKKTITLEQKIQEIKERLNKRISFCFSEIAKNSSGGKADLIINFLALLELTKRGLIMVKQDKVFGEIEINKTK
ncbi:MAG: segregation/condensation protein A [Candidatus Pacebacteria bacterium]|nr:segregation/condensation protein A [Candidatus Paceibacterota bacterium]